MKTLFITLLTFFGFLVFATPLLAQNKLIDSLENEIAINKLKDTTRVNNLDHLAFLYYRKDLKKAIAYMEESEILAKKLDHKKGMSNSVYTRGIIEMAQSNFDSAIKYFEEAAQMYETYGFKKSMSSCYNGIGVINYHLGNYDQALEYYKKALHNDEELGTKTNLSNYVTNIGSIYMRKGDYKEALAYYKRGLKLYKEDDYMLGISSSLKNIATVYNRQGNYPLALEYNNEGLKLAEKIGDSTGILNALNNIGLVYQQQKKYDKALELFERAQDMQISSNDKKFQAGIKNNIASIYKNTEQLNMAVNYLNESLQINREIKSKSQIAETLNNLGFVHVSLEKYTEAFKYYEEAKNINLEIGHQASLSYSYLGIADSYMQLKKYDKAKFNLLKSLEISEKLGLLDLQKDAHELLSEIYKQKGQFEKALYNQEQFKRLNDSLFNKKNIEKVTQLEYEHKYKQALDSASIRELQLTKTVTATNKDLEKIQRNYLWAIIGVLVISILFGGIIFYQKYKNIVTKNQNILTEQKLLRSQMTPHFIFNSLSVLQGMILNKEEKNAITYLSKFSKLLRTILENSRHKTVALSEELSAIDDYMTLQNLDVNPPYNYSLTVVTAINVSRFKIPPMLIQPFIENAIEHAFPHTNTDKIIDVILTFENDILVCTITDNGVGITMTHQETQKNKSSLATKITSERLEMLSKDFKVQGSVSVKNRKIFGEQGTLVTLVIPYKIDLA